MNRLFLSLVCLSLSITTGCGVVTPGWQREDSVKVEESLGEDIPGIDGPTNGHFDSEGNWIPNDPTIALTYRIPDISAGFLFDIAPFNHGGNDKWSGFAIPAIQIELFEFNTHIPYINTLKFDAGVGYQRGYIYIGKLWTNIFEISTGAFVGWNWDSSELSYGLGATIIKF